MARTTSWEKGRTLSRPDGQPGEQETQVFWEAWGGRSPSPGAGGHGRQLAGGGTHLSHVDLGSLLEHGSARHVKSLLQPIKPQRLHLLVAALHLQGVVGQLGQLLHVLQEAGPHG